MHGDGQADPSLARACGSKYWDAVQSRWTAEHMATHAEVHAAKAGIAACMRARGVAVPDGLAPGGVPCAPEAHRAKGFAQTGRSTLLSLKAARKRAADWAWTLESAYSLTPLCDPWARTGQALRQRDASQAFVDPSGAAKLHCGFA